MWHDGLFVLLALAGFCAGFIDSFGGGGGLIGLPTLLAAGFPPVVAMGTNKMQMMFGEFSAASTYFKHKGFSFARIKWGIVAVISGATLGAIAIQYVHADLLKKIIPFVLLVIVIYTTFKKTPTLLPGESAKSAAMSETKFFIIFGLLIGFYNGFFGPATGTIWTAALMGLLAYDLKKAIMYTKPLNFLGNLFSLVWFIGYAKIAYLPGFCMAIGNFIGGKCGAHFVLRQEVKWIKRFFLAAITLMTIYLFIKYYF